MNIVILAGGLGSRLAEETEVRPKPMVEIGGRPILWHIMRHYWHYGFDNFLITLGYKGDSIKRYFWDYFHLNGDLSFNFAEKRVEGALNPTEDWKLSLIDTGQSTMTGGRVKRLQPWLEKEPFMLTYGDGVSNVDLAELYKFHKRCGRLATITAVRPPARFGGLEFENDLVSKFIEKPQIGEGWINGGFMVFEPQVLDYIQGDETILESGVLEKLADEGQLAAYRHDGFWQCMDTIRDKRYLETLWQSNQIQWTI